MTALEAHEIRAQRRPWLLLSIAGLRLSGGFIVALPLAAIVAESGIGLRGEGDRALFEDGGYLLLELLRLKGSVLGAAARGLLPLLALALAFTCFCNVALLLALNVRGRVAFGAWLSRAAQLLPAQLVVSAGAALTKLALLFIGAVAAAAIPDWQTKPVQTSVAQLAAFLPFVVLCGAVGGVEDLTKASLVRRSAPLMASLSRAARRVRERPLAAGFGWLPYALGFVLVALLASKLVEVIDVARPGSWRIAAVFVVHQLVTITSVACRAAWFARALRAID